MLGDGEPLDLLIFYLAVRKKGGYKRVSENGLWGSVAVECGLDVRFGLALKLFYIECLNTLLELLQGISEEQGIKSWVEDSYSDILGRSLMDLGSNLQPFLCDISKEIKKDAECVKVDRKKFKPDADDGHSRVRLMKEIENDYAKSYHKDVLDMVDVQCLKKKILDQGGIHSVKEQHPDLDKDKFIGTAACGKERVPAIRGSESIIVKEDVCCGKRKRECASDMLNWILRVAQDPCDPEIGSLPESSEWKSYATDSIWKQVLSIREALLVKKNGYSSDQHFARQQQKMHPMMYGDHNGSGRLRCSQRILSSKDPLKKACAPDNLESSSQKDEDSEDESPETTTESMPNYLANSSKTRVFIGPQYQADMPEWAGKAYEVDSKWSGTRTWPPDMVKEKNNINDKEPLGKGRPDSCECPSPGSLKCVRVHVSEKRLRLRLELGLSFYLWKFNRMGEETAISWTNEEENKFCDTLKVHPLSEGCFWDEIVKILPKKDRASLVSYYFNVFLLRRRADQNRTTPYNITSDDDESDNESEDVKPPGSIFCSPKKTHLKSR